ncbi:MAG: cell surface protein, partial [Bauldia litoralis]
FNSILDDAKGMVDQLEDGKIDIFERATNVWMKVSRGDIAALFDNIHDTYLTVSKDTKNNIDREHIILEAYMDFRGALKQAEVSALEVLKIADAKLAEAKATLETASAAVKNYDGDDLAERARLELIRDERLREMQSEDGLYQIAKDLAVNLTMGYNTSEVVMARLNQTTNAKERVYQQAVSFFTTNESVLTALQASFTGMFGLHESTETLNRMKEGVSQSIEVLAEIGGKVQEEALKAGYGPTIRADAVKKLVDSVVNFQDRSHAIINEMRTLATKNSEEIRDAVEDGKRRMAQLATDANAVAGDNLMAGHG